VSLTHLTTTPFACGSWQTSILGSTYTGWFESVSEMAAELDEYEKKTGNYVPIHVDAASGGFVA
jgi:glutamate decarboxylase